VVQKETERLIIPMKESTVDAKAKKKKKLQAERKRILAQESRVGHFQAEDHVVTSVTGNRTPVCRVRTCYPNR
jgi:hypothetical protein